MKPIHLGAIVVICAIAPAHAGDSRTAPIWRSPLRPSASPRLSQRNAGENIQVAEAYGRQPLGFEANHGQTGVAVQDVQFVSRGAGYTLFLTSTEAVLRLRNVPHELRMKLVDSNPAPRVSPEDELPGKSNYLIGNDRRDWHTQIPRYGKVKYQDVYPGVDLVYYGNQQQLEYDFLVAPGADPDAIELAFEGARNIRVDAEGDLLLETGDSEVRLKAPVIYQETGGHRVEIPGGYRKTASDRVAFHLDSYDRAQPLVVDPVLVYSTYLGGSEVDWATGIAVDQDGSAYVTGQAFSIDFPTSSSFQQDCPTAAFGGCIDAFVTKLSPDGGSIVYSTYFGGTGDEGSSAIAIDGAGNAYVTGSTRSFDFPTVNPVQPAFGSDPDYNWDAFVAKFSADGSALLYSTYLGGADNDFGFGIAVDNDGRAYVTGTTYSTDFPTVNPRQPMLSGSSGAFVASFAPDGFVLLYSTYLGNNSAAHAIAVDGQGYVSVTGETTNYDGSNYRTDGFVTSLGPGGSLLYNRSLTAGVGFGIAIDGAGNTYVTGVTGGGLPLVAALQSEFGGLRDAFVAKLDGTGNTVYSSYLGGSGDDRGSAIAVDATGNIVVVGITNSVDFPTLNPLQEQVRDFDVFITKMGPTGLIYSTTLGGSGSEYDNSIEARGPALALDALGNAYVAGLTWSDDFPVAGALQPTKTGYINAFVAKIFDDPSPLKADLSLGQGAPPPGDGEVRFLFNVANTGPSPASEVTFTDMLPAGVTFNWAVFFSPVRGYGSCVHENGVITCNLGDLPVGPTAQVWISLASGSDPTFIDTATVMAAERDPNPANNTLVSTRLIADPSVFGDAEQFGANVHYFLGVLNNGPGYADNVRFTDRLPAGSTVNTAGFFLPGGSTFHNCANDNGLLTCNLGSVAPGMIGGVGIFIDITPSGSGSLTNTATIVSSGGDYNLSNNGLTLTTEFSARHADLAVAQSRSPAVVTLGSTLTYTLDVTNNGPSEATSVSLLDHLASGETFVSATATPGSCGPNGADDLGVVVGCGLGVMPAGAVARVTIVVRATGIGPLINTATVTSQGPADDPSFNNNSATIVTPVNRLPIANAGLDQIVSAGSACQAIVTLNGGGSSDPDGDLLTYTWTADNLLPPPIVLSPGDPSSGTVTGPTPTGPLPLGAHTITLTVNDGHGGTSSDTVVVTVRDVTAPTFSGEPAPVTIEQSSASGTAFTVTMPTAADNCSGSVVVSSNAPAVFPRGATTVTFTVADAAGNSATATTTVTVVDTTPPTFSGVPPPMTVEQTGRSGASVTVPMPTANDMVSGSVVVSSNAPAIFPRGVTTVTFTAADAAGNAATATTTVTVGDTTPPTFSGVPSPMTVEQAGPSGTSVAVPTPVATDAVSGSVAVSSNAPAIFPRGSTTVTFTARDAAGNSATATTTVTVVDTTAPALAITSPQAPAYLHSDVLTMTFSASDAGSGLAAGMPVARLDGAAVGNSQKISLLTLALGTHTFVLTAADVAGNSRNQSVTVTVVATIDSLIASVNVFAGQAKIDDAGTVSGLLKKLNDAKQAVQGGKKPAAISKLQDFIGLVEAQRGRHITVDAAQILIADAQYVIGTLR